MILAINIMTENIRLDIYYDNSRDCSTSKFQGTPFKTESYCLTWHSGMLNISMIRFLFFTWELSSCARHFRWKYSSLPPWLKGKGRRQNLKMGKVWGQKFVGIQLISDHMMWLGLLDCCIWHCFHELNYCTKSGSGHVSLKYSKNNNRISAKFMLYLS